MSLPHSLPTNVCSNDLYIPFSLFWKNQLHFIYWSKGNQSSIGGLCKEGKSLRNNPSFTCIKLVLWKKLQRKQSTREWGSNTNSGCVGGYYWGFWVRFWQWLLIGSARSKDLTCEPRGLSDFASSPHVHSWARKQGILCATCVKKILRDKMHEQLPSILAPRLCSCFCVCLCLCASLKPSNAFVRLPTFF